MDEQLSRLVQEASRGDAVKMRELLQENLHTLQAFVRLRAGANLRARESVADVVQSVCREALEDLPGLDFTGPEAFRAWLFKVAVHKLVDRQRAAGRQKRDAAREVHAEALSDDDARGMLGAYGSLCTPSRIAGAREELARVEHAIAQLPEDQREAVVLARIAWLPMDEIANVLGRTESAVRGLVARGLARVATLMGGTQTGR